MKLLKIFLLVFLWYLFSIQVGAQEGAYNEDKITGYNVNLTINKDRSISVVEEITVSNTENGSIQRGIFRDFPTLYKGKYGLRDRVDFEVLEVKRDGVSENYVIESISGGKRIRIGQENYFLPVGFYTYTITYNVSDQIRSFENSDELYYNLIGTEWEFQIDYISAEINLPQDLKSSQTDVKGYSGKRGEENKDFELLFNDTSITLASTRVYAPQEGLAISISFPKGYVSNIDSSVQILDIVMQNIWIITAVILSLSIVLYYYFVWLLKGKDPYTGAVIPIYEPPRDLTPGQVRYLDKMGYDDRLLTATIVDMGVKGYLKITEQDKLFSLKKVSSDNVLTEEQKILAEGLFGGSSEIAGMKKVSFKILGFNLNIPVAAEYNVDEIELSSVNSGIIQKAVSAVKISLHNKFDKVYIHHNSIYFVIGLILNAIAIGMVIFQNFLQGNIEANGFIFFSLFWNGIVSIFVFLALIPGWITFIKSRQGGCSTLFLSVFLIPFIAVGLFMLWMVMNESGILSVLAIFLPLSLHAIFYKALKVRTREGRELQNQIDGFKMYLGATEEERFKFFNQELPHTFETFQKYLPYAIALDMETKWTQRFNDVISDYTKTHDSPGWYTGNSIGFSSSSFASSMSSTLSSSISSSSSSGSSGGSSGGGSGGGGGGGW